MAGGRRQDRDEQALTGWRAGGAILRYVVLRYLRTIAAELPGTSELAMERAICLFRYIAPVWPI